MRGLDKPLEAMTKFLFFYVFYRNLKEKDHIKRNNIVKKGMFISEISIIILVFR